MISCSKKADASVSKSIDQPTLTLYSQISNQLQFGFIRNVIGFGMTRFETAQIANAIKIALVIAVSITICCNTFHSLWPFLVRFKAIKSFGTPCLEWFYYSLSYPNCQPLSENFYLDTGISSDNAPILVLVGSSIFHPSPVAESILSIQFHCHLVR